MEIQKKSNIAAALAAAQSEMGKAFKETNNLHFRSKYADLGAVIDACLPALNKHEICLFQPLTENELGRFIRTVLMHSSGESVECSVPLLLSKNDMQGLGSAMTYARRYGLMTMAGIAPEDDDGNAAVESFAFKPREQSWVQTILSELQPAATDYEKADAITKAVCSQFHRKKTVVSLNNEWDRRRPEIGRVKQIDKRLHETIVDAFENQKNSIEEMQKELT